jgi:uncharacterized protein
MKYLLVLAVLMVAFWIWRNNRLGNDKPPPPPAQKPPVLRKPTTMVACLECGTHLPQSEAVMGRDGAYCSPEHRALGEDRAR